MITYQEKPLLFEDFNNGVTDAIVIPVNCFGVMGAGVALEAKKRYPNCEPLYKLALPFLYFNYFYSDKNDDFYFAATKDHWRSNLETIEKIVSQMAFKIRDETVGVPALGCGLGGLDWNDVKSLYEKHLTDSPVHFICYLP